MHDVGHSRGCAKIPFLKVAAVLLPWWQRLLIRISIQKIAKSVKCSFFYLKLNKSYRLILLPFALTSFVLLKCIKFVLAVNVNTLIDYLSRYRLGHFCWTVIQGKRLYLFLYKYSDCGTEITPLVGSNIVIAKYVKFFAGWPPISIEQFTNDDQISDITSFGDVCIRRLQQKKFQTNRVCMAMKERIFSYEQYPELEWPLLDVIF